MTGRKRATALKVGPPASAPGPQLSAERPSGVYVPGRTPTKRTGHDGVLRVNCTSDESAAETTAKLCFSPVMLNAITAMSFTQNSCLAKLDGEGGKLDPLACVDMMIAKVNALAKGDTTQIEQHLICQAVALEAIFTVMARRAALNMGTHLGPTETYLRLALKAQSQSRATLETLAEIKNPRPIYINPKQVNNVAGSQQVNNAAGPQQVNNGTGVTRAEENKIPANELLDGQR